MSRLAPAALIALALAATTATALPAQTPPLYPDPTLTPGDFFPDVTAADVCTPGYATAARHVTKSERDAVFAAYGVQPDSAVWTLDHFIPLNLGGSDAITNLWPEPIASPGSHEKDKVEDYLHAQVCSGAMTLDDAREAIRNDWYVVYLQITGG